jgi:hypothetical protein
MVVTASTYHKGFYASNDVKVIHRYLPRSVGEMVVWYLWLVISQTLRRPLTPTQGIGTPQVRPLLLD